MVDWDDVKDDLKDMLKASVAPLFCGLVAVAIYSFLENSQHKVEMKNAEPLQAVYFNANDDRHPDLYVKSREGDRGFVLLGREDGTFRRSLENELYQRAQDAINQEQVLKYQKQHAQIELINQSP